MTSPAKDGYQRIPQAMLNFSPLNDRYAGKLITINYAALCNFTAGAHAQTTYPRVTYLPASFPTIAISLEHRLSPFDTPPRRRIQRVRIYETRNNSSPLFSLSLFVIISQTFDRPIAEDRRIRVSKLFVSHSVHPKTEHLTNCLSLRCKIHESPLPLSVRFEYKYRRNHSVADSKKR